MRALLRTLTAALSLWVSGALVGTRTLCKLPPRVPAQTQWTWCKRGASPWQEPLPGCEDGTNPWTPSGDPARARTRRLLNNKACRGLGSGAQRAAAESGGLSQAVGSSRSALSGQSCFPVKKKAWLGSDLGFLRGSPLWSISAFGWLYYEVA